MLKKKHKTTYPTGFSRMFTNISIQMGDKLLGVISTGYFIQRKMKRESFQIAEHDEFG